MLTKTGKAMELSRSLLGIIVLVLYWLTLEGTADAVDEIGGNETDHLALLEFKAQISEDPFGVLSSWNASTHFCNWFGVTCSRRHYQRVTFLDLPHSTLSGSISPHIGNLSFLVQVNLQNNSFTHHIPPQVGNLRRLQQLWLNNNSMQGSIPVNISACSHLTLFAAHENNLLGEIPVELGSLSKLLGLSLRSNYLTGNIPSSFGNLSSLERLYVDYNTLKGSIPNELGHLTNLNTISMAENMLSGVIPPSLFNLSSITTFHLGSNQIHGTLPSRLFNNLPNLQFFSIGDNQFTGPIPISLSNASNLAIFQAAGNKLDGGVPFLEKLQLLRALRLANNNLGTGGDEGDLIFLCSMTNATSLSSLSLHINNFGGPLPECIGNLSNTLTNFLLNNNRISGGIPIGTGNLVNLERFYISDNNLSGDIPIEIGNLQKMQDMALDGNKLSGKIPSSLGNLKLLSKLYLNDNNLQSSIPSNLSQCQNLIILNLGSNNLSGSIPLDVMGISSLSIGLSLARNRLSGVLPMEIANLRNLGILDVSDNLLSGEIPSALGSCVSLEVLKFGGNFFQGGIPSSLRSLRGIAVLNLSHNNLSGKLPKFLESFALLQRLDLSYNNFDGMVPMEGVFKNASRIHVEGNNELCGGIPQLQLPKCSSKKSKSTIVLIPVLALFSIFLVFLLSIMLLCCFKKKRAGVTRTPSTKLLAKVSSTKLLAKVSYQHLLLATDNFSSTNLIGIGSFGVVYKGVLENFETVVAIKVLNLLRRGALKSFVAECEALKSIRHRNLVKVITACSSIDHSGNDFKALVYELMVNGSLNEWLHPFSGEIEAPRKLSFVQRMNIMIDVGNALDYLHHNHQQSPIVHCDLKPSNVLLDAEMIAHVGDFGLARFLREETDMETSSVVIRGSIGYTPPEYGMGSELSTNGDMYSYGILLLEAFTGKRPTDDMFQGDLDLGSYVKEAFPNRVMEIAYPSLHHDAKVVDCLISILGVGVACSAQLSRERLSISDALTQLRSARDKFLAP